MPSQKKKDSVLALSTLLSQYDSFVLANYSGVTHKQLEKLRKDIKTKNAQLRVVKNSLFSRALSDAKLPQSDTPIQGTTAALLLNASDFEGLKLLYETGAELGTFTFNWGVWEGTLSDSQQLIRIAKLPSRLQLQAQLVGTLSYVPTRLVWTLKGNLQKLVIVLTEVEKKKTVVLG